MCTGFDRNVAYDIVLLILKTNTHIHNKLLSEELLSVETKII